MNYDAPLILSLDTATDNTSVAVMRGERVLAVCSGAERTAHNVQLLSCVDEALGNAKLSLREIDLLAVTTGPGTFTGLRAGLATIKAFAATLRLPLSPVPTLHAVAVAEGEPHERIIVMLPAGRREVFAQTIALGDVCDVAELSAPRHVAPEILLDQLDGSMHHALFVGAGARLYANQLRLRARQLGCPFAAAEGSDLRDGTGWRVASPSQMPLAVAAARLAVKNLERNEVVSAGEVRALYVRPSDAELKNKCQK